MSDAKANYLSSTRCEVKHIIASWTDVVIPYVCWLPGVKLQTIKFSYVLLSSPKSLTGFKYCPIK